MARVTGVRRFLIPDLALTGAAFTLLYCLLFYDGARNLFRDSDSGWHIRNGEAILAEGKLPATDPYSFSKGGEPWFAWEWGSDVLMGAAHRGDGLSGVVLLYLAAIACCTWIWFRLHWEAGGDFLLACAMASPMLSTVNLHWLARPHVFGWVLALAWVLILERGIRSLTVAALLDAIWANAHGSFFLLPFIALAYAARDIRYLAVAAAGLAGTFVNPYGWKLHAHVFQYLSNGELLKRIGEFQTFNFHSEGAAQILLGVGIAALGASLALMQRNFTHFLVLAAMSAVALRSARGLPLLALLLPLANGAITRAWQESGLWPRLLAYSGNLRRLEMGFAGIAWAAVLLGVAFAVLHTPSVDARAGFDPAEFPVAASAIVESLPA